MKRIISAAILGIAFVTVVAVVTHGTSAEARRPRAASTASSIALNQDPATLHFQSPVTFTTVVTGLQGTEYPMVVVRCSRDGNLLYAQLDYPYATFILGGGSSPWWSSPGPASCTATLYAYGGKSGGFDTIRELAAPINFNAAE